MFISLRADYKGAKIIAGGPIISELPVRGLVFDLAGRVVAKNFCGVPFETYRAERLKSSWPKDVERYVAIEVSMATNTPFILEQHREASVLLRRVHERYRSSKNAMFIIDCAQLVVGLVLSAKSPYSDDPLTQFNAEYMGDFTSLSQARETDAALLHMRRNEIKVNFDKSIEAMNEKLRGQTDIVLGWQDPKLLNISCRSSIKEIEMKRIVLSVNNVSLSVPFTTQNLDLLMSANVLDRSAGVYNYSDAKPEVNIILGDDIQEAASVLANRKEKSIEQLKFEVAELEEQQRKLLNRIDELSAE